MSDTYEHGMGGLDRDEQGWDFCRCDCGWVSPPCPDTETALDFWGDHIMEAEGVPEDRIVPEGMANIGGVTYWAHPTTCGCSYYRAEMMTEGPCVCGHDQDDHDYYDGGCEAPDPHRARLVPLSDTPHEEGEQP